MSSKKIETEMEPGTIVGAELHFLETATNGLFTLWSVEKMYVKIEFRVGTEDHMAGFNMTPPAGKEVLVAIERYKVEDYPEGVLSSSNFQNQFTRLADMVVDYRERILSQADKKGF